MHDESAESKDEPDLHEGELRSFGRRRGRKLSALQDGLMRDLLPKVAVDLSRPVPLDMTSLFASSVQDVWLEIGFGGGEHLVWQAQAKPEVGIIGCEPFVDGIVKVLTVIDREKMGNIRLHADDARAVLRWLPEASIGRAFVLFPDPWPKRKHQKRRLVNAALLAMLARVIRPGGELRVGTDIADYARTILMAFQQEPRFRWKAEGPDDWRIRPQDWPQTRYEAKAVREGRRSCYLLFERV